VLPAEAPRARRPALLAAAALTALALLAAGCGDEADEGEGGDGVAANGGTELEITLDPDGDGGREPLEASVVCEEGGEAHPACAAVERLPEDPGAETPPGTACTELYGGPDVLRVTGTLRGAPIDAEVTRADGCEIARFDRFAPLLEELFPDYRPGGALNAGS
jgi:hypothetical protein